MNRHLRKAFSKCFVRGLRHSQYLQKTGQSCGVTIPLHHLSWPRGVGVFLTHLCTVYICLTLVGLFFWEGPLDSCDFLRSHLRVEPRLQASRLSQELSCHAAMQYYTFPISSPFLVLSVPVLAEKSTLAFFPHTYILCNQNTTKNCSRYCDLGHGSQWKYTWFK